METFSSAVCPCLTALFRTHVHLECITIREDSGIIFKSLVGNLMWSLERTRESPRHSTFTCSYFVLVAAW